MMQKLALPAFIIGVVAIGSLIGVSFAPGAWYEGLNKPSFNPPNWIFGPAWTLLYILIGIAGWRAWFRSNDPKLRVIWTAQMVLNFAWSPTFFGAHSPLLGLVVILLLLSLIVTFIGRARASDPMSAALFLPYAAWVGFATVLNASIALQN